MIALLLSDKAGIQLKLYVPYKGSPPIATDIAVRQPRICASDYLGDPYIQSMSMSDR